MRCFLWHFLKGLRFGYPACCSLRWSWQMSRGSFLQARERGVCLDGDRVYVPCCIFHRAALTFEEWGAELNAGMPPGGHRSRSNGKQGAFRTELSL